MHFIRNHDAPLSEAAWQLMLETCDAVNVSHIPQCTELQLITESLLDESRAERPEYLRPPKMFGTIVLVIGVWVPEDDDLDCEWRLLGLWVPDGYPGPCTTEEGFLRALLRYEVQRTGFLVSLIPFVALSFTVFVVAAWFGWGMLPTLILFGLVALASFTGGRIARHVLERELSKSMNL